MFVCNFFFFLNFLSTVSRCLGSVLWASSLILFVMVNAIMSFLIFLEKIGETGRISRVVILECLILLMGTVLGICIILVRGVF